MAKKTNKKGDSNAPDAAKKSDKNSNGQKKADNTTSKAEEKSNTTSSEATTKTEDKKTADESTADESTESVSTAEETTAEETKDPDPVKPPEETKIQTYTPPKCPGCKSTKQRIYGTSKICGGTKIRRYHRCKTCNRQWSSEEKID